MRTQVGGSLQTNDPTYVIRQADRQLYTELKAGRFCYVLNARQTGKSSLLQRTSDRLQKEGCACVYLDMTQLKSERITDVQWYRGLITVLYYSLNLVKHINLQHWWSQKSYLSPAQQLHQFTVEVLLPYVQNQQIFIFIDEIDSLLSLNFSTTDFFAWICNCHQQPTYNFNQLGFVLSGVATPADLIADRRQSPFLMGTAIELHGFQLHEIKPLQRKLEPYVSQPKSILQEILYWTNGHPFLTQKLCQLVFQSVWQTSIQTNLFPATAIRVKQLMQSLVQSCIIQNWELQDEPEHLRTIRDRLLFNPYQVNRLLVLYQQLLAVEKIPFDASADQIALLLSGLVEKHNHSLKIANPIYRAVFNYQWVKKQLDRFCPASISCV